MVSYTIDLSKEKLIPLKTLMKRRDGALVVYTGQHDSGEFKHRCCPIGGSDYFLTDEGRYLTAPDEESNHDIVAVARPWQPKNGDRVEIVGYMDQDNQPIEPKVGRAYFIADDHTLLDPIGVVDDNYNHFRVLRNQLRRYVAPAASEELQVD